MHPKTIELKAYRDDEALSQSFLKSVISNNTTPFTGSIATMVGSLSDCILYTPECLQDWFHISKIEKYPTAQWKDTLDKYFETYGDNWDDQQVLGVFREISNSRSKDETVLEALKKEMAYFEDLIESSGKEVVSQEYWNKCNLVAASLLSNPLTTKYFQPENNEFQKILYWKYDTGEYSYNCKGLLDDLHWNHKEKTVKIVDIKTSQSPLSSWKYNIARRHNPAFQLAFYYRGVAQWLLEEGNGYKQERPMLIVENVDYPGKPRIYNLTEQDLFVGTYGAEIQRNMIVYDKDEKGQLLDVDWEMKKIYGWTEAIQIYHECKEAGLPDYDIEYYRAQGIFDLNLWL